MKVLGTNIYGGGFGLGVRNAGTNLVGTVETWKPGMPLARMLGITHLTEAQKADMVIMNPPCSRFSSMSTQHYTKEQKHDVSLFIELCGGLDLAKAAGASIIWWENGPIAFTSGRDIIRGAHKVTGAKKTLVLKLDPTYGGLVQLRPRTHVIHFMDDVMIPDQPERIEAVMSVREWVDLQLGSSKALRQSAPDLRYFKHENPVAVIKSYEGKTCFNSCKPALIRESQRYAYAVLSSRQFAWEKENRWWSVPEYAAIMTYPHDLDYESLGLPIYKMLSLLAKSVMPEVARYVFSFIIRPALASRQTKPANPWMKEEDEGIFYARLLANHHAYEEYISH